MAEHVGVIQAGKNKMPMKDILSWRDRSKAEKERIKAIIEKEFPGKSWMLLWEMAKEDGTNCVVCCNGGPTPKTSEGSVMGILWSAIMERVEEVYRLLGKGANGS